jgi:hypothetical protein
MQATTLMVSQPPSTLIHICHDTTPQKQQLVLFSLTASC